MSVAVPEPLLFATIVRRRRVTWRRLKRCSSRYRWPPGAEVVFLNQNLAVRSVAVLRDFHPHFLGTFPHRLLDHIDAARDRLRPVKLNDDVFGGVGPSADPAGGSSVRHSRRSTELSCRSDWDDFGSSHWITSSAPARILGGIVRPSAFPVLRFTASLNLRGGSTGIAAGLVPLRIRSTKPAARRNRSS